ncbi:CopG family transcriptional regulator [Novosphingobium sp. FKTRR1]|uniref:CopG family transcriptional regulator n=1 Tax=Novosphingobium sp. FKTRR1 TaxID=2879118 RepID=UPI001CF021DB|nr:CopG family transcriptional regulator [Novosphingobium sp. FKTRR1]
MADAAQAAASAKQVSRSNLLRIALQHFLGTISGTSEQDRRRQFSSEYLFLVADLIVQRQYPDVHTALITEAEARMEAVCAVS